MKSAVLAMSTKKGINVGDYIQGLAAAQFFDKVDSYLERERLNSYTGEECKIIMNGWFMHEPKNWPPSEKLNPLYVAFHLNSTAKDEMLSDESIAYLKKHQPIGCRDRKTMEMLKEKGVDAYFSGCMTLTLGEKYKNTQTRSGLFFVDPYARTPKTFLSTLKYFALFFANFRTAVKVYRKDFYATVVNPFTRALIVSSFVHNYKKIFGAEKIRNAEYVSQVRSQVFTRKTNEEYFEQAKNVLNRYVNAEQVVTSRIHCALPCLGMETPVVYVNHIKQKETDECRLDGLVDLFNIVEWDNKECKLVESPITEMLSKGEVVKNKDNWRPIKDKLVARCKEFTRTNI